MDSVAFTFGLDTSGAIPRLCLLCDCGGGLYSAHTYSAPESKWVHAIFPDTAFGTEYTRFEGVKCILKFGARELVGLHCLIVSMVTTPPSDLDLTYWRAFFLVWQSNVFDADTGGFRNTAFPDKVDAMERGAFAFTGLFSNLGNVSMSTSAVQTFVSQSRSPELPTWPTIKTLFLDAPHDIGAGANSLDITSKTVPLFQGSEEVVSSQTVSNIYNIITRAKALDLAAWPGQEATTASVGGGLLHLGISLALSDGDAPEIAELRRQFADAVDPLQLSLLNALLSVLQGTSGDGLNLTLSEDDQTVLSSLPYVFGPDATTQFKCVEDASTFKCNDAYVSLELKTRWADGWYTPKAMRDHFWQASLQALASTVHRESIYFPAVLLIKIPPTPMISSVQMHFTKPKGDDDTVARNTVRELLCQAHRLNTTRSDTAQLSFCNGRVLSCSTTTTRGVFKLFSTQGSSHAAPTSLRVGRYTFPLIRSRPGNEAVFVAPSTGLGFTAGPRSANTTFNPFDIKVYGSKEMLTFQHISASGARLKSADEFARTFERAWANSVDAFNLIFIKAAARLVDFVVDDELPGMLAAAKPFLHNEHLTCDRFKSLVLAGQAGAGGATNKLYDLRNRFIQNNPQPTFILAHFADVTG